MIDNKFIRRRARELFTQNWPRLTGMMLLGFGVPVLLMLMGVMAVVGPLFLANDSTRMGSMAGFGGFLLLYLLMLLVAVLWYPPLMMGLCRMGLRMWRGYRLEWKDLFYYLADGRRLLRVYGKLFLLGVLFMACIMGGYMAILAVSVAVVLVGIPLTLMLGETAVLLTGLLSILLFIVGYCALIWMEIRFGLVLYVMVEDEAGWPIEALKTSWRATKKNFWRIFRMFFALIWPITAAVIVVMVIAIWLGIVGMGPLVVLAGYLLMLLAYGVYAGYMVLALGGMASELLGAGAPRPAPQVQWSDIPDTISTPEPPNT